jgi:Mg-chelatase subunit ChlD
MVQTVVLCLPDSEPIEIEGVHSDWTWEDLFDYLYDESEVTDGEYAFAMHHEAFQEPIGPLFPPDTSEPPKASPQNESASSSVTEQPRKPTIDFGGAQTREEESAKSKELKPSSTSNNSIDFSKTVPSTENGSDTQARTNTSLAPLPSLPSQSALYTVLGTCSKNQKGWKIFLKSNELPAKSTNTPSRSKGADGSRLHLVLDDSGSMNWAKAKENLILSMDDFLSARPPNDEVSITTLNGFSTKGMLSPKSALSEFHRKYKVNGGTPIGGALSRMGGFKNGDVLILFSDGSPTDPEDGSSARKRGNFAITQATSIKQQGVRFISVGCGSEVNSKFMEEMASTSHDYHHAKDSSAMLETFREVAKSLRQSSQVSTVVTKGKTTGPIARCVGGKVTVAGSKGNTDGLLEEGFGFPRIEDFSCPGCSSNERLQCGHCNHETCGGGVKGGRLTFPLCAQVSHVEDASEFHVDVGAGGPKK